MTMLEYILWGAVGLVVGYICYSLTASFIKMQSEIETSYVAEIDTLGYENVTFWCQESDEVRLLAQEMREEHGFIRNCDYNDLSILYYGARIDMDFNEAKRAFEDELENKGIGDVTSE